MSQSLWELNISDGPPVKQMLKTSVTKTQLQPNSYENDDYKHSEKDQ